VLAWNGLPASYQFGTLTRDRVPSGVVLVLARWLAQKLHQSPSTLNNSSTSKYQNGALVLMMPTLKFYRRAHKSFFLQK